MTTTTTNAAAVDATAATAAPADDIAAPADDIDGLRQQIDDLDAHIAALVTERAAVSKRIQAARISFGGTRFELSRERVVLDHYRAELGTDGPGLAEAILRICRGTR